MLNKRELVLSLLDGSKIPEYIPAAFFLHFDPAYHQGQTAIDKHLEYFRYTGMDFVKIQYEHSFPHLPWIQRPEDWGKMPLYKKDFFETPLQVVEGLVKAVKKEALVITTLYSPFMCAGQVTSGKAITDHIQENPAKVKNGMEVITESLMTFVKGCIDLGVDGFYHSTQGGEAHRFADVKLFDECVKPYDLALMNFINQSCIFNILHVCDYNGVYRDLTPFLDYPGHIVNCGLQLEEKRISPKEVSHSFGRPYMGGLNRKGTIATGSKEDIRKVVLDVLQDAPERFILGADCTVPSEIDWDNLRIAIDTAHEYRA
jgi:uroporphyrinogen decarboxylase